MSTIINRLTPIEDDPKFAGYAMVPEGWDVALVVRDDEEIAVELCPIRKGIIYLTPKEMLYFPH